MDGGAVGRRDDGVDAAGAGLVLGAGMAVVAAAGVLGRQPGEQAAGGGVEGGEVGPGLDRAVGGRQRAEVAADVERPPVGREGQGPDDGVGLGRAEGRVEGPGGGVEGGQAALGLSRRCARTCRRRRSAARRARPAGPAPPCRRRDSSRPVSCRRRSGRRGAGAPRGRRRPSSPGGDMAWKSPPRYTVPPLAATVRTRPALPVSAAISVPQVPSSAVEESPRRARTGRPRASSWRRAPSRWSHFSDSCIQSHSTLRQGGRAPGRSASAAPRTCPRRW